MALSISLKVVLYILKKEGPALFDVRKTLGCIRCCVRSSDSEHVRLCARIYSTAFKGIDRARYIGINNDLNNQSKPDFDTGWAMGAA